MNKRLTVAGAWLAMFVSAFGADAEDVRVLILAGQSNMVGYGSDANELPPNLQVPQTDVLFWFEEGPFNSVDDPSLRIDSGDAFVALQYQTDLTGATFGGLIDGFGPEMKLGRTSADALPVQLALVKFAINATSLADDWNPDTPGSLYEQMTDIVTSALSALTTMGHTGEVVGFFWMQGEWDALNATDAGNYEVNLTNLIQQVRAEYEDPSLSFVFGRLNENIWMSPYGILEADLATVRAAQEAVAQNVPNTEMIDTDDLPLNGDFIHFTAAGQLLLGERFANAYVRMTTQGIPTLSTWGVVAITLLVLTAGTVVFVRKRQVA